MDARRRESNRSIKRRIQCENLPRVQLIDDFPVKNRYDLKCHSTIRENPEKRAELHVEASDIH